MKAEELRIGVYLWNEVQNCHYECRTLDIERQIGVDKGVLQKFVAPIPIPLTEEWLLKLGFEARIENDGNLPCFKRGNITIAKWIGDKWQVWYKTVDFFKSPQTVHELQNLYFALTDEELEVKP